MRGMMTDMTDEPEKVKTSIHVELATLADGKGGFFTGLKFAHGMMEANAALPEEAVQMLIDNLPDALADLRRQRLGLVVPQQAVAPKLYTGEN